jgi:hypothetical protein
MGTNQLPKPLLIAKIISNKEREKTLQRTFSLEKNHSHILTTRLEIEATSACYNATNTFCL